MSTLQDWEGHLATVYPSEPRITDASLFRVYQVFYVATHDGKPLRIGDDPWYQSVVGKAYDSVAGNHFTLSLDGRSFYGEFLPSQVLTRGPIAWKEMTTKEQLALAAWWENHGALSVQHPIFTLPRARLLLTAPSWDAIYTALDLGSANALYDQLEHRQRTANFFDRPRPTAIIRRTKTGHPLWIVTPPTAAATLLSIAPSA